LKQLKLLNLPIKLDTNGTSQTILQQVIDEKLVDYIAMDVKATKLKYARAAGAMVGIAGINRTIEMIKNSGIDYEFRTTIVPSLHEEADIREIAEWISPAKRWALQQFRPGIWQENSYPAAQLERFAEIARNVGKFGEVIVRHA
jgi:pyruvate formate lyase activating enzyme